MRGQLPPEWQPYYVAAAALFGVLIGSFLNVCIYRIPRDLSVVFPRSFCPECGTSIAWYDNVPLIGFLVLGGRCRTCRTRIGLRYPAVELATAVLLACVAGVYGWSGTTVKWGLFECIAVVLFWTDMEERILPDEFTIGGTVAGLLLSLLVPMQGPVFELLASRLEMPWPSIMSAGAGAFVLSVPMWMLGAIYHVIRRREGLGLGDVKLLALIGSFLGLENGIRALLIGTIAGAVLGVAYIGIRRKKAAEYPLPYGSFLCAAAAILPLFVKM